MNLKGTFNFYQLMKMIFKKLCFTFRFTMIIFTIFKKYLKNIINIIFNNSKLLIVGHHQKTPKW